MPIIISDNGRVDRYNCDRLTAIRNLITTLLDLTGEELASPPQTELDQARHNYLRALEKHIAIETDKLMPRASEASKNDALKKLFEIPQ